jgi:hypothetical protein
MRDAMTEAAVNTNGRTAPPCGTTTARATSAPATDDRAHLIATLAACGLAPCPGDEWHADELAMVADALADLLAAARWTPAALVAALGGPITLVRDRSAPITTDAAGTRFPILGLYDAAARLLTVNDWSFDPRVGGAANGRRVLLHELAHAWDRRARHRLALGIALLPGSRASAYAASSPFEDWAEAVMGAVYGADPGHESFQGVAADVAGGGRVGWGRRGGPSPRLRYVRRAFARWRRGRSAR